ncbi:MAG: FAD-dependent oxidoreductase [Gemmatimonadetes bacterium]|nr:FAD-dependent oxidoreductase [Gemmatimonadota bacterium]
MERTAISRKEFERGVVLGRVGRGELTLKECGPLLKVSFRQAKRLYKRFRMEGPAGRVHRSVGRVSNRARAMAERERILEIVREHYRGTAERGPGQRFGPTLVAEHLWEDHGVRVPGSTLRDWMGEAGLPENRIYFAGEHCSLHHGWIQRALETSLVAVRDMLASNL